MSTLQTIGQGFLSWWGRELRGCLPTRVATVLFGTTDTLELALSGNDVAVGLRGADGLRGMIPDNLESQLKDVAPSGFQKSLPSLPKTEGEAIKRLLTAPEPAPKTAPQSGPENAYGAKERATMDRAIENATG